MMPAADGHQQALGDRAGVCGFGLAIVLCSRRANAQVAVCDPFGFALVLADQTSRNTSLSSIVHAMITVIYQPIRPRARGRIVWAWSRFAARGSNPHSNDNITTTEADLFDVKLCVRRPLSAIFLVPTISAFHRQTFSICFSQASLKLPWLKIG
jgi:hypothetical protein